MFFFQWKKLFFLKHPWIFGTFVTTTGAFVRFQALAKALQTTPARLVWAHGASDMILRTALAAAKRAEGAGVCLMVGGCP